MSSPSGSRRRLLVRWGWVVGLFLVVAGSLEAQPPRGADDKNPGQFFPVTEPITHETLEQIQAATRQLVDRSARVAEGREPVLVFEFRPGEAAPGGSKFGTSYDLATYISKNLGGAKMTVAYVPEPLKGYAVLAALACDELVMGPDATLGPITPEGENPRRDIVGNVKSLAIDKQRDPDLLLGMVDRTADLRAVKT